MVGLTRRWKRHGGRGRTQGGAWSSWVQAQRWDMVGIGKREGHCVVCLRAETMFLTFFRCLRRRLVSMHSRLQIYTSLASAMDLVVHAHKEQRKLQSNITHPIFELLKKYTFHFSLKLYLYQSNIPTYVWTLFIHTFVTNILK